MGSAKWTDVLVTDSLASPPEWQAHYSEKLMLGALVCVCVCIYVCVCVNLCMYVCMRMYVCTCMYVRVCMYVYVCVCIGSLSNSCEMAA